MRAFISAQVHHSPPVPANLLQSHHLCYSYLSAKRNRERKGGGGRGGGGEKVEAKKLANNAALNVITATPTQRSTHFNTPFSVQQR